jgi:hypothetical protein
MEGTRIMGNDKHACTLSHGRRKRYNEQGLQVPNTTGSAGAVELFYITDLFFMKKSCFLIAVLIAVTTGYGQRKSVSFKKTVITNDFVAEGCAVGDVNKDGRPDIMAGTFWFESPSWKRHEIAKPEIFKPTEYSNSFMQFSMDVNQDGWIDLIRVGYPGDSATWYENPKNKMQVWTVHSLYHSVGNESPALFDIDNDGKKDLVCADSKNKKVVWISPPATKGDTVWKEYVISNDSARATFKYTHGLGFGDMNLDGRADVIYREGWWEAPVDRTQPDWTFHAANLSDECSHMYARDLDGDGDQDIISSSAHHYGIWWHEQVKHADTIGWIQHNIFNRFSQTHGLMMADINSDGHEDLVTGKRYYAHNGKDPGAEEPAVLYWFEFKPGKNPSWVPHMIDNNSGAGLNFIVQDINNDKRPDIIISNKKGVFVFEQLNQQ